MAGILVHLSLFVILLLPCSLAHLHTLNTSTKSLVSHIYAHNPPLRPNECLDEACISKFNKRRLSASSEAKMAQRRTRSMKVTNSKSAPVMATHMSSSRLSVPWAPITLDKSIDKGGDYYLKIWIGARQPQLVLLTLDTASEMMSVQCHPCNPCHPQVLPIFDPVTAASHYLTNRDPFCQKVQSSPDVGEGATRNLCKFGIDYGDNTTMSGAVVDDTLWFVDAASTTPGYNVELGPLGFGCANSNQASVPSLASGSLGLARGVGLSLPEQLNGSLTLGGSFSYCLPTDQNGAGFLMLGENSFPPDGYDATPLVDVPRMPGRVIRFWHIGVVGIKVRWLFGCTSSGRTRHTCGWQRWHHLQHWCNR